MPPPLEMTDNRNTPLGQLTEGGKETARASKQRRIAKQLIESKSKLTRDINNVKHKLEQYETNFSSDDYPCEVQLEDASEIVRVYNRADSRFIHLENGMDDLKTCICESIVMTDDKTQKELDNVDSELIKYEKKLADVRKNKKEILGRCKDVLAISQRAAIQSNTITNN